jgi:hypothetical protein
MSLGAPMLFPPSTGLRLLVTLLVFALSVVVVIGYVAGLTLLQRLAARLPNMRLARQTVIVKWGWGVAQVAGVLLSGGFLALMPPGGGPAAAPGGIPGSFILIGALGCVSGLGQLVFGVWALVLLFVFAWAFRAAAETARRQWHAA